jgi:flavin reductase (DIM6/NTAB) family NADH-FMN oxidoreductase RutF
MATDSTTDEQPAADDRPAMDPLALRVALSRFPTGVCIVTTLAPDGQGIGLTVNSFASVSLDPPLVLWSLRRSSPSLPAFRGAPGFAINVLAADQHELSSRFARPIADKFDGVRLASRDGEDPLIERAAAHFSCATWQEYDGGDHVIFIGKVLRFTASSAQPLAFVGGRYATVRARTDAPSVEDLWPIPFW